jgi:hypothetical protein
MKIHRSHWIGHHQPIWISESQRRKLIPILDETLGTGLMAISAVEVPRFQRDSQDQRA